MQLFAALRDQSVDTVFADPPFNLGKDYGNGAEHDELDAPNYLEWCSAWIEEAVRVLKPGGAFFIYHLPQWAYRLATHLETVGMTFRHWIAISMKGTFPRGRKLYPAHYALLYFTKGQPKTFNRDDVRVPVPLCRHCKKDIKDYGGHRKYLNPLGLNLTDFWEDTAPARHTKFKARWGINELKPLIPARCIQLTTHEGEVILDPFAGGGSTFEAAEKLKRMWIGSEIVDCSLIRDRFERNVPEAQTGLPQILSGLFKQPNPQLSINRTLCHRSSKKSIITAPKNVLNGSALHPSLRKLNQL
ncbi:MAG TPA: site-specific DNA-methyltransferase [Bryobacteraceae bacterium]|nr:site-specific DNA-methyltransferase [Bryobacteraceae bacterium]